jgi:hypothetical protein
MPSGRLDFDHAPALAAAVHIHGELDAHSGEGTLAYLSPVLTEDLHAQLCSTDVTWELWRTDAGY